MYIYVMGRGHSGSTILDILMGGGAAAESVGELCILGARGLPGSPSEVVDDPGKKAAAVCSCGAPIAACPFWTAVRERFAASGLEWQPSVRALFDHANVRNFWGTLVARRDPAKARGGWPSSPASCRRSRRRSRGGRQAAPLRTPTRSRPGPCSCSSTTRAPGSSTSCATRAGSCRATTGASAAPTASVSCAATTRSAAGRHPSCCCSPPARGWSAICARSWRCGRRPSGCCGCATRICVTTRRAHPRDRGRVRAAGRRRPGPARARRAVPGRAQCRRQPHPPRARGAVRPGHGAQAPAPARLGRPRHDARLLAADAPLRLPAAAAGDAQPAALGRAARQAA